MTKILRIFISYPIKDEALANKLKKFLEKNTIIKKAYIANRENNFEVDISQKIIKEIKSSHYLVAIVTKNTIQSASVHQELGFAQGIKKPRIPMIEKGAKKVCYIKVKTGYHLTD